MKPFRLICHKKKCIWFQINLKSVITIQICIDSTKFIIDFSLRTGSPTEETRGRQGQEAPHLQPQPGPPTLRQDLAHPAPRCNHHRQPQGKPI